MEDPYGVLGLTPKASSTEIKQTYRKLSLKYHPDRNPGDNGETFKKINKAYEILSDDKRRSDYNTMKKMGVPISEEMFQNAEMFNPNDILNMIFSDTGNIFTMGMPGGIPGMGGMGGIPGMGAAARTSGATSGWKDFNLFKEMGMGGGGSSSAQLLTPIKTTVDITIEQAFTGCTIGIEIERNVSFYNETNKETEKIYFDIPEGADDNEIIMVTEKGHVLNGNKGDVQIFIRIEKHEVFEREGMNLIYHKTISFKDSLCGFSFDLKYINDQVYKICNRAGNIIPQFHEKNVANLGMKRNDNRGMLVIKFNVEYPDQLTPEQVTVFEENL